MYFLDAIFNRKQTIGLRSNSLPCAPSWYLVWGAVVPEPEECTLFVPGKFALAQAQPCFSPKRRFGLVGDVWLSNRVGLLNELGIHPDLWTGTDAELLVQLWETYGIECLGHLTGRFGCAIWDCDRDRLWLVRDRVGASTLYYVRQGSQIWLAPRLRTLKRWRSNELDPIALRDYLSCAFVPGARTLWQQVQELRPGTVLCWPANKVQVYWQPTEAIPQVDKPLVWYGQKLRSHLEQIVQEYLPCDEPLGIYLSGGLDSSCITALATQFHDRPIHTYSIHFGADCRHELEFSGLVAAHCRTQHHILEITPDQMWHQFLMTMSHLDDPIGDPLTVPNYLVGQLASQQVRIILNGEGGDPCFGGPKNQPMLLNQLYHSPEGSPDPVLAYLASFKKCALDLPQLLLPEIWQTVQTEPSLFATDLESEGQYLNRLMLLNIKFKGADHILTKVNNLTCAAGLDGRSPLFDPRIVQLAMETPPQYKLAGANEKAVLKQAVADLLPPAIIQRPKSGMMVPVQLWFRQYWQRQAKQLLLHKRAAIAPYLNQALIQDWLHYRNDTWGRYGAKLWLLVSLELWLQANQ